MIRTLLLLCALVACDEHGKSPPLQCDSAMCTASQLCRQDVLGIDAGASVETCVAIPPDCEVTDCEGQACPPCLQVACQCSACFVSLTNRHLLCSGG